MHKIDFILLWINVRCFSFDELRIAWKNANFIKGKDRWLVLSSRVQNNRFVLRNIR